MKRILMVVILAALGVGGTLAYQAKAYDVRNGGATAWTVQFADAAAKNNITDAICEAFDYAGATANDPNPPTKNQFAMRQVQHLIGQSVKEGRRKLREKAVQPIDETDIP